MYISNTVPKEFGCLLRKTKKNDQLATGTADKGKITPIANGSLLIVR